MKPKNRCYPHYAGLDPAAPLSFDPSCEVCQTLRAAGKRTGLEPLPVENMRRRAYGVMRSLSIENIAKRDGTAAAREHMRWRRR